MTILHFRSRNHIKTLTNILIFLVILQDRLIRDKLHFTIDAFFNINTSILLLLDRATVKNRDNQLCFLFILMIYNNFLSLNIVLFWKIVQITYSVIILENRDCLNYAHILKKLLWTNMIIESNLNVLPLLRSSSRNLVNLIF